MKTGLKVKVKPMEDKLVGRMGEVVDVDMVNNRSLIRWTFYADGSQIQKPFKSWLNNGRIETNC